MREETFFTIFLGLIDIGIKFFDEIKNCSIGSNSFRKVEPVHNAPVYDIIQDFSII